MTSFLLFVNTKWNKESLKPLLLFCLFVCFFTSGVFWSVELAHVLSIVFESPVASIAME